jgi:hypothetical protein
MTPSEKSCKFQRFDDLVRTERYFTATLLPLLLFHNNLDGVRWFVKLVDEKATTEYNKDGKQDPKGTPNYDFKNVEVITEFHIARDLKFRHLKLHKANGAPSEDVEETRSAPDLVITAGQELVVCEGKFFGAFNPTDLNEQLCSQRRQVRHLFCNRSIRAYRHVAIVPYVPPAIKIDADAVLTWADIRDLAEKLMGPDHYVTARLRNAIDSLPDPTILYFDGLLSFEEMRKKCRESEIMIGFVGGEATLLKLSLVEAEQKQWKWRDRNNKGATTSGHWLRGARWLEIVESSYGFGSGHA